jgi:transcription elongation GreA/GreB family factor
MNKLALLELFIAQVEVMAARAERARRQSQTDANSYLGRQESRYDTFKEEAQYLEAAQQHRVSELGEWLRALEDLRATGPAWTQPAGQVALGSVVTVRAHDEDRPQRFFLLPVCTGDSVTCDDCAVESLSLRAPLGQQLLGRRAGERVDVGTGMLGRPFHVEAVE